jgi:PAS domain S-box-containing protein
MIWALAGVALHSQRTHSVEAATQSLMETCRLSRESVERTLESVDRIARLAVTFHRRMSGLDAELLDRLAASAPGLIDFVAVADAAGNLVAVSGTSAATADVADRDFFVFHRDGTGDVPFLGAPRVSRVSNNNSIPLSRRIDGPSGAFEGVVVVSMMPARLLAIASAVDLGSDGAVGLVGQDGLTRVRVSSGGNVDATVHDLRGHAAWAALVADGGALVRAPTPIDGVDRLAAFEWIGEWPIAIFVEIAAADMAAHARAMDVPIVGAALLASLAVFAMAWLLRRRLDELESAQHAILDRERRFRDFAETTADWFWEQDADLRFTFLSDSNYRLSGTQPESQYGMRRDELGVMGVDESGWAAHRAQLERREAFRDFRYERFDAIGRRRFLSISGKPIFDDAGRFAGYRGSGRDMTEEMEARQALAIAKIRAEDSERTLRDGIEALRDAFLMFDASRRVLMWNRKYEEMYPHVRGQIEVGMLAYDLMHLHAAAPLFAVPAAEREAWVVDRLSFVVRGGVPYDRHLADGRTIRVIGFSTASGGEIHLLQDVTADIAATRALTQAKETAEAASDAKSRFLATMSHEVRTPINGVMGMASLLLDTALDSQQRLYVHSIRDASDSLLQIINDVLDFSKLEAGRLEFEDLAFDLNALVRSTIEIVAARAKAKNLTLEWQMNGDVPERLRGDPGRLRQVLLNLLSNAIKFTEQGSVRVEASARVQPDGRIRGWFSVRDTGIGIPADRLPRLFREFEQLDGSIARRFGGTGLGLAISRRLVARMGGELRAESTPGKGSVFLFDVLLTQASVESDAKPGNVDWAGEIERLSRARSRPLRILLAEDNQTNRLIVSAMLEPIGLRVDTAGNGLEAVEAQRVAPYDLILMDVNMPEMDGYAATAAIRALDGDGAGVPIVAVTANAFETDREAALAAGMDDFISKPFRKDALLALVVRHLAAAGSRAGQAAD